MSEIIFLAVLALIVIGPKELPELARTLGRFLNELKRSTNVLSEELKQQARPVRNNSPASEKPTDASEPQQMELTNQSSTPDKPEEHKPS